MSLGWLIGAIVVWLISAVCIISTLWEVRSGKTSRTSPEFWGAVVFHGATAVLTLWMLTRAIPY